VVNKVIEYTSVSITLLCHIHTKHTYGTYSVGSASALQTPPFAIEFHKNAAEPAVPEI
jgi:hypothetical protein